MIENCKYDILTPNGFEHFDGIQEINKKSINIEFNDNTNIVCSENHIFVNNGIEYIAKELKIGSCIGNKKIKEKTNEGFNDLYDIINSGKDHLYMTNNLISHNCSFDGTSDTFLSTDVLKTLEFKDPLNELIVKKEQYILNQFEHPIKDHYYILTLDPSEGIGQDNTGIHVWDVSIKGKVKQVATMYNNKLSEMEAPYIIAEIANLYNEALIVAENNKCDKILENLIEKCNYDNLFFNREDNRYGIRMSEKKKRRALKQMEIEFEAGRVEIYDYDYIHELSVFVEKGRSYAADDGEHDDLVMSSALLFWIMSYDELYEEHIRDKVNYMKDVHNIDNKDESTPLVFFENGNTISSLDGGLYRGYHDK